MECEMLFFIIITTKVKTFRVMIFNDGVEYILLQYYFKDEEHPITVTKQHGNSKSNKKSYRKLK